MENETFLRAAAVAQENNGGQAEVAAPAPVATDNQASAEIAAEQQTDVTPTPAAEVTAVTPEPTTPTPTSTPSIASEPYDYWKDLNEKTAGVVKDEDSLKSLLSRSTEYETLAQQKEELEKTMFKPANEYISKLNEMTLAGANADQITAFVKLNGIGKLEDLSPIDVKVTKMVLVDGFSEDVARAIVEKQFDATGFDETLPEQALEAKILREQLRVEAKKDLETLNTYKADLSVVSNPAKDMAEQQRLQQIADMTNYNKQVSQQTPEIIKYFPEKLSYDFKVGDEVIAYEDSFDKDFLTKELAPIVEEYFKDSGDPINNETIGQAFGMAHGEYLKKNIGKMLERSYLKGLSAGDERTSNKYENRSGLPKAQENQIVATTESGLADFTKRMLGKAN